MENDDIEQYLESLQREGCYRVDAVLKQSPAETTQRVFFEGANGAETGPYIRKFIRRDTGMGGAYEQIFKAQRSGRRFKYIPDILECYRRNEELVVIMECVRGQTLQDVVYEHNPSLALAEDIIPRLCDAVAELHGEFDPPIIHRDLKPSNVILAGRGLALIDFGISREYREDAERDTTHFGTREFAPPEQFGFGQTGVYSDVYALGMVLYYCLTEEIPDGQVRARAFRSPLVPEAVRQVIVKAGALDPDMRYGSAAALRDAFVAACAEVRAAEGANARAAGGGQARPAGGEVPGAGRSGGPTESDVPASGPASAAASATAPASAFKSPRIGFGGKFAKPKAGVGNAADTASARKPPLGAWNIFVAAVTAFFVFLCVLGIVSPPESTADQPVLLNFLSLGVFGIPFFLACGYTLADRRKLAERNPLFKGLRVWMLWAAVLALLFVSAVIVAVLKI